MNLQEHNSIQIAFTNQLEEALADYAEAKSKFEETHETFQAAMMICEKQKVEALEDALKYGIENKNPEEMLQDIDDAIEEAKKHVRQLDRNNAHRCSVLDADMELHGLKKARVLIKRAIKEVVGKVGLTSIVGLRYTIGTFREAGLEAIWTKTKNGGPIITVRMPKSNLKHQRENWYDVHQKMWNDMKEMGIIAAYESHTLIADVFSI